MKESGRTSVPNGPHEGVFLAETYLWQQKISKNTFLKQAHESLLMVLNEAWEGSDPIVRSILLSPYELLVLASIVEKETALASERPRIAGVFLGASETPNASAD